LPISPFRPIELRRLVGVRPDGCAIRPLVTMSRPRFQVVSPDATPEEIAAIAAALAVIEQERAAVLHAAAAATTGGGPDRLDAWVRASRLSARRAGLMRGPWRLSGRIGRRSRA
jgi:hypothetical protein